MGTHDRSETIRIARELFAEAYEGPAEGWSWFVNAAPDAGVLGTIEGLTTDQASRALAPGGRSIAAHTEHLRWSLDLTNRTIHGEPWNPDWSQSWTVQEVTDERWEALRAGLRRAFEELRSTLDETQELTDPMMLRGVFALAPHAAHHLGTIRAMAKQIKGS